MNKRILLFIVWVVLVAGTVSFGAVKTRAALPNIVVQFQTQPLFSQANFTPGQTVTKTVIVTNNYTTPKQAAVQAASVVDASGLAGQLNFVIKQDSAVLFTGTLQDIINGGENPLSSIAGGATAQYDLSATFNPSAGNQYQGKNASFDLVVGFEGQTLGTIFGMKFNDLNRDGVKQPNEPGLKGWTITLRDNNNKIISTTITDSSGNYSFTNLPAGSYKVREVHQKGWKRESKNPKSIVILSGSVVNNVNFGNSQKRSGEQEDTNNDDARDD